MEFEKKEFIALAARIYFRMFFERFNRYPMAPAACKQLSDRGTGTKYAKTFERIVDFLLEERKSAGGADNLDRPLRDYYRLLFEYYARFRRIPTMKQISPGSVMSNLFITYTIQYEEDGLGKYWSSKESIEKFEFIKKYPMASGWVSYDPILPDQWDGPGDPTKIPELNKGTLPVGLDFEKMVEYGLINPPSEDIETYNRLFKTKKRLKRVII
jgi:hypothetical protein